MSANSFQLVFQWLGLVIPLIIGGILVIFRPYLAFLFAVLLSVGLSFQTQSFSRTEELGAFFTMYDAILIIFILAFLFDFEKTVTAPGVVFAMLAVLLIGLLHSTVLLGLFLGPLRMVRWAITIPFLFIFAASMVRGERRLKAFMLTLLIGAVLAEAQHLFLVKEASQMAGDVAQVRSTMFIGSTSEAWLLAGPYVAGGLIPHPWVQLAIGSLFLLTNISHQTRSILLGFMGGLLFFYGWFVKGPNSLGPKKLKGLLSLAIIGALLIMMTGFSEMASSYWDRLIMSTSQKHSETETRALAFKLEIRDWLDSNLITGRGLYYYDVHGARSFGPIAWGHLGYVSYLSQMGIVGLLVYGFWFPGAVLRRARRIIKVPGATPAVLHLACLTGACFLDQAIIFLFSGSYLQRLPVPGLLAGAIWAIPLQRGPDGWALEPEKSGKTSP